MKLLAFVAVVGLVGCLEDRIDIASLQNGVVADSNVGDGVIGSGQDGDLAAGTDTGPNDADVEIGVDAVLGDGGDLTDIIDLDDGDPKVDVQDAVVDVQDVADVLDSGPVVDVQKSDVGLEVSDTATTPKCGNLKCESGETKSSCPQDCNFICGNGKCDPCETSTNCAMDCKTLEDGGSCDSGAGDAIGVDVVQDVADGSSPVDCVPAGTYDTTGTGSCKGKCGGSASNCNCDTQCGSNGDCCSDYSYVCGGAQPKCGNKACEYAESSATCPQDCPAECVYPLPGVTCDTPFKDRISCPGGKCFDALLGIECSLKATPDGKQRCVPTGFPLVNTGRFFNDTCSTPIYFVSKDTGQKFWTVVDDASGKVTDVAVVVDLPPGSTYSVPVANPPGSQQYLFGPTYLKSKLPGGPCSESPGAFGEPNYMNYVFKLGNGKPSIPECPKLIGFSLFAQFP